MKKILPIGIIAVLIILFFAYDLHEWLTLDALKASQAQFADAYEQSPLLVISVFFIAYVAVTALSLPGATIMTLAGGALFGLWVGLLVISFASTIGATLAFLVSRYLLRDTIQSRFQKQFKTINEGVEKEGAFYLFTLRLVPVVPFFLINLVMGLTNLPARTFYWVSQVGMFAGTIVYVNAGTQLGKIDSLSGILSPALLASFVLLGIFPLIAKRILDTIKKRRVYKQWQKPKQFDRNLVVIGGGAAGLVSAYIAAAVKAKVTLVEAHKMGGDCLNFGCVPSKAIIKSTAVAHQMQNAEKYGLESTTAKFSFKKIMQRVHETIAKIEPHDSVERYTKLGVEVLQGYATIIDPWTVEIALNDGNTQRLTTRNIIIAAGASPIVPEIDGLAETGFVTSDTLWETFARLDEVPKRLVVLGGGPIGTELTQAFARLGSHVTQIERSDRILKNEDLEVSELAAKALQDNGVTLLTGHQAVRCEVREGEKVIITEHEGTETVTPFDQLLLAVGRQARLTGYGLENLGIETQRTVITNEYLETLYPNIYAAGDVAGPYQFTHTASHQAWYAAVNALFGEWKSFKADYSVIPWATFIDPEVARVGLNEQEAKQQGIEYEVTTYGIDDLDRAIADSEAHGFIKVLTVPNKDKILGVTIVANHASDLLAEYVLAMKHGLGLNKILGTIHTYPTMSEANKYVAGEWKRAHAPETLLAWVEKYHAWKRG